MTLIRLFTHLLKKHLFLSSLVIIISTLVVLGAVGLFSVSSYIIAFSGLTPSIAEIMVPVVGVRFFGLSRGILRYVERLISHDTTFRILSDLRNNLYQNISKTRRSELLLLDKEDAFIRLVDDIERLQEFYLRTFNPYITALLVGIIGVGILNQFSFWVCIVFALFYGVAVIILPILVSLYTRGLYRQHVQEVSLIKNSVLETISGLSDILASSAITRWKQKLQQQWKSAYEIEKKLAFWKSLSTALISLLMNYALLMAVCVAGILLATQQFEAVFIPVIAYAIFALFEGAQPVAVVLQKLEESHISAVRIEALNDRCVSMDSEERPNVERPNVEIPNAEIPVEKKGNHLKKVCFSYPGMEIPLLQDITIDLVQGKKIALIGASGSGKTTLSYVLLDWLKPSSGSVIFDGNPEEQFSVVNQKVYFFNTTIANNLRIARIEATDADIIEVLSQVELMEFIDSLPLGIHTELGEGDLKLSGGQRQRLAIARALLRNTPYLIFDEITAGLDVATEKKVLETLLDITAQKGILVLTHRLIQMESYDEILVLEAGCIVERGKHVELLESNTRYAEMYNDRSRIDILPPSTF